MLPRNVTVLAPTWNSCANLRSNQRVQPQAGVPRDWGSGRSASPGRAPRSGWPTPPPTSRPRQRLTAPPAGSARLNLLMEGRSSLQTRGLTLESTRSHADTFVSGRQKITTPGCSTSSSGAQTRQGTIEPGKQAPFDLMVGDIDEARTEFTSTGVTATEYHARTHPLLGSLLAKCHRQLSRPKPLDTKRNKSGQVSTCLEISSRATPSVWFVCLGAAALDINRTIWRDVGHIYWQRSSTETRFQASLPNLDR